MSTTEERANDPIDPLTDTGKIYLVMRKAIRDAREEERRKFDPARLVRNICNIIVKDLDERLK